MLANLYKYFVIVLANDNESEASNRDCIKMSQYKSTVSCCIKII